MEKIAIGLFMLKFAQKKPKYPVETDEERERRKRWLLNMCRRSPNGREICKPNPS